MSKSPPSKRQRQENGKNVLKLISEEGTISPELLLRSEALQKYYQESTPFNHGFIKNLCVDGFLNKVLSELKQNSKVKFKESDLFRVYQSIDLGNLTDESPMASQIPSLMRLKKSLYSEKFRSFMESIACLEPGTLTDQVDCAANCHTQGCHLLCHDDVIGNRKISFIIYLTDPDQEWLDKDGGRLELYESMLEKRGDQVDKEDKNIGALKTQKAKRVPKPFPSKTIIPTFNSLAYFAVTPGESFHSVQEVFCDRPRLTIQGWYHTKDPPSGLEEATLSQLKSSEPGEDTEGPFFPMLQDQSPVSSFLSESDRVFLSDFINETYLKEDAIKEIREQFEEESSVQLRHFIKSELANQIRKSCNRVDTKNNIGRGMPSLNYQIGIGEGWEAMGPSHKQRFLEFTGEGNGKEENPGALLKYIQNHVFRSAPFGRFLSLLSSLGVPLGSRGRVRRFRPGLDYTVAHYGILTTQSVLDATLCFVAGEGSQPAFNEATGEQVGSEDDMLWVSGDVGGFECYIAADEDGEDEADDEYDGEDDTELLSVPACDNTLSLVFRNPGTMRFVKYVGSLAPSSRWDISIEYEIEDDDDDNEENMNENKDE